MPRHGYKLYHTRVPAEDKLISQKIACLIKPGSIPSVEKSMSKKIFIIARGIIYMAICCFVLVQSQIPGSIKCVNLLKYLCPLLLLMYFKTAKRRKVCLIRKLQLLQLSACRSEFLALNTLFHSNCVCAVFDIDTDDVNNFVSVVHLGMGGWDRKGAGCVGVVIVDISLWLVSKILHVLVI